MAKQTAVEVAEFSSDATSGLRVNREKPVPEPSAGQVLVRMRFRPINPSDHFSLQGVYAGFQPKLPAVPGLEGVGVVEKLGEGVSGYKVGQRVVGAPWPAGSKGEGSWQEYIVTEAAQLVPVPDAVSDEDAAQYLVNPVTAACFLEIVPPGEWLLHNTANSVLGKELIAMAKHKGVKTINLVRRKEAAEELLPLGSEAVIDISQEADLPAKIKEITGGQGVYAAFNPIGGAINGDIIKGIKNGGTCWIYSVMGDRTAEIPMADVLFRDVSVRGFWLMPFLKTLGPERSKAVMLETMDLIAKGICKIPPPSKVFPLEKVTEALAAYTEFAGRAGKVLLES